jgi:hypothetical protein
VIYFCAQANRRELVLQSQTLNGIDYLEVLGDPGCGKQLAVTFLKDVSALGLSATNVSISGGAAVQATAVEPLGAEEPKVVIVDLDHSGDFSTYTFALVAGAPASDGAQAGEPPAGAQAGEPPTGVDPQLASIEFSFKAGCPTPADCLPSECCPSSLPAPPDINYLAKDYPSFLQVMLDRLAVLTPTWTETHAADLGVAIAEALAYAADHLSYQQDAVSTEAYLGTARSRISLRRHARLVDYQISEGCNARTLVAVTTAVDDLPIPTGTLFYVGAPGLPCAAALGAPLAEQLAQSTQPVFSAMQERVLYLAHNEIQLYTWADTDCCLPQGATQATLEGTLPELSAGDMLIFEEVLGPDTGQPEDADPAHRCAVCLTSVRGTGTVGDPAIVDPLTDTPVTQIAWAAADALAFPLCISSTTDAEHGSKPLTGVSVARANVVAADHGVWLSAPGENLGTVPAPPPAPVASAGCQCAETGAPAPLPRFYPSLEQSPLTFSVPYAAAGSAAAFLSPDDADARPAIEVRSDDGHAWQAAEPDLLSEGADGRAFVPEIEYDGTISLRFGDGQYGMAPDPDLTFSAVYRIGGGAAGNIGREALAHAVLPAAYLPQPQAIVAVRNPLPASGGVDPETMEHIRQFAPFSYQTQERCVTEADYAQMTEALSGGLQARGTLRWTGSWYTAFVSIDPTQLTPAIQSETSGGLEKLRMMGTDVAVEAATIVGLAIELSICVDPQHLRGDVYDALMEIFVSGNRCDGAAGLLDAANFSFGQTVYASPLVAAAQAVEGVVSVRLSKFTRMDAPWVDGVAEGCLTMGRLDIPRCDNDPNHLDHGTFALALDGGR